MQSSVSFPGLLSARDLNKWLKSASYALSLSRAEVSMYYSYMPFSGIPIFLDISLDRYLQMPLLDQLEFAIDTSTQKSLAESFEHFPDDQARTPHIHFAVVHADIF